MTHSLKPLAFALDKVFDAMERPTSLRPRDAAELQEGEDTQLGFEEFLHRLGEAAVMRQLTDRLSLDELLADVQKVVTRFPGLTDDPLTGKPLGAKPNWEHVARYWWCSIKGAEPDDWSGFEEWRKETRP